ncbi:MAG TPA: glycosyl hydrolase family 18 protein [Armatimonadota bacterium]
MSRRFIAIITLYLALAAAVTAKPIQRNVTGYFWLPEGDSSPYWTLADHADCFTALAPTWLSFDASGKFTDNSDKRLIRFAHAHGIKVTPLVANSPFRAEVARPIFANEEAVRANVALLLKTIQASGADGVNVDIEGVAPANRPLYNAFIEALCKAFHDGKLIVTLDLPAKTADTPAAEWAGFGDYAFLAKHADQLQLMCYDEHWSGGKAGPIASIPWVRKVMEYATAVIPKEKVVMGVPNYGYDWPATGKTTEVTAARAYELLETYHLTPEWDADAQTCWFEYTDAAGVRHTVYFEHERTRQARLALAKEFGIAGVSIWRLGEESSGYWAPLKRFKDGR